MEGFDDFLEILDDSDFEEIPVGIEEFVRSSDYLGLPPLSEEQYKLIRAETQIYFKHTLVELHGEAEGERRWNETCDEVIAQWGKGSGKDYCSTIAVSYVVYQLLCLKDPQAYYGKPPGDTIDILNIAINSEQAKNVFFKGFKTRIERSKWFQGKYIPTANAIEFPKNITCYSGHSQRESWEGYNVIMVILDEISGFALDSTSGNTQAKTAEEIYKMYRGSVVSRFPEVGKTILLSFPRFKDDFIQQRYNSVVAQKDIVMLTHTLVINKLFPEDMPGNSFEIEWEHENIIHYSVPNVYATRRTSWEVNPTKKPESYMKEFLADSVDALSRFACMPPDAIDAFFKSREKIELAFSRPVVAFHDDWRFRENFVPKEDTEYFVHVDLGHKHDRCVVSMAHVEGWQQVQVSDVYSEPAPYVIVDAVRYWTPKSDQSVDFTEVRNYIVSLSQRGFNLKLVTFDQWQSIEMMNNLLAVGIECDKLPVAKKHYEDLQLLIQEERIKGPDIELLREELLKLRIIRGDKVDHPRTGSKDLADSVCGAVHNAVAHSKREQWHTIEVKYLEPSSGPVNKIEQKGPIKAPAHAGPPPSAVAEFLSRWEVI